MPIYSPTGFLDITNATLRTSNTECQNLKIGTGNLYVTSEISPDYELNLSNVTNLGATSPHTLTLSNVTTAIDATSNIITSGNLKIGGLIYTKDWGFRSASGSNDLYVGRFTVHGITEVLITDQGASLGSASKYTITRNFDSAPIVNGIDSSSTIDYQWYYHSVSDDDETYDLWVRPSAAVQTNIKVTSSTYIEVDEEPSSSGADPCVNGLITMSGNVVANQNLTVSSNLTVSGNATVSTDLTVSGNTFYTSPVSINVDSNVVTEYTGPHDRPLRKYPEVALSITSESASGENGYKVSWSSIYDNGNNVNERPFRAFDGDIGNTGNAWMVPSGVYGSDGTYAQNPPRNLGTATGGNSTTVDGEYIILQTPNKIKVKHFRISDKSTFTGRAAEAGKLYGSNDGSTWYELASFSELTYYDASDYFNTVHVNATTYYDRLALVVTNSTATSSSTYMGIGELEYYGYEEGSGSLDTTLKTVFNVPATTGTQLEVYYDANKTSNYTLSGSDVTNVSDLSPQSRDSTATNVTIDSTWNAFRFSGSGSETKIENFTISGGDYVHSISLWFNSDEDYTDLTSPDTRKLFFLGADVTSGSAAADGVSALQFTAHDNSGEGYLKWYHWSNDTLYTIKLRKNEWYHVVLIYKGGTSNTQEVYVNNKFIEPLNLGSSSNPISLPTTIDLFLGRGRTASKNAFKGMIANFRLYSKALNADQVKELYDYQKDYFLGSKSQVTLYKGHLGVGVTEPSGQLELAGDERIQEYPPRALTNHSTYIEGHGVFTAWGTNVSGTWPEYQAFDDTTTVWYSDSLGEYSNGDYGGTKQLAAETAKGAYVVLEMPYEIVIKQTAFTQQVNGAHVWDRGIYYAKRNPSDEWTAIHNVTDRPADDDTPYVAYITDPRPYKYFAIVITRRYTADANQGVSIQNFKIFGTPGPTTLDKGSLTLGRSLDVPRVSRYDVDTETPRPEKLVVDFDTTVNSTPTDISGQGNHGKFVGNAQYSAADKAFKFDGSGDYITVADTGAGGNWAHSFSFWFKPTSDNLNGLNLYGLGDITGGGHASLLYVYTGTNATGTGPTLRVSLYGDGQEIRANQLTIQTNRWYHMTVTNAGGVPTSDNCKMYVDGVQYVTFDVDSGGGGFTDTLNLAAGTLDIGRQRNYNGGYFPGQISNFKLYSVALEPSEVRKLYNLGRTGRSMVISDTAVGIGKVPEAQLDVRGVIDFDATKGDIVLGGATIKRNVDNKIINLYSGSDDESTYIFMTAKNRSSNNNKYGLRMWTDTMYEVRKANTGATPVHAFTGNLTVTGTYPGSSDDRIKFNESAISNPLNLIAQLNPQKYERISDFIDKTGTWIPTDAEWESVKNNFVYIDEFGLIAQDVRNIPELAFLVNGEETRTDTDILTHDEYSNLTTEEQDMYTTSYIYDSNVITQEQYSNLTPEEQEVTVTQYKKQIETQTPLSLNYQGLFVVAIGAIKELKAKNEALETQVSNLLERVTALENA